jgi:hypothetical protein
MGRKFKFRYEKRFFDPQLGIVGSGATRYVDAFNRDAAQRIQLQKLTSRLRLNVNMAAPPHAQIPRDAVIYGIANSKDKMNYRKAVRARKLTEMHAPLLDSPNGPWETLR